MFRTTLLVSALWIIAVPALGQSQDPLGQLLANFDRIDVNGDGVISNAEYGNVQAARWSQIDRNGDGYLGEDDFPRAAASRARAQLAEIAHLDTDGDGRISQSEFINGPAPVFVNADQDGDGALSQPEVAAAASR